MPRLMSSRPLLPLAGLLVLFLALLGLGVAQTAREANHVDGERSRAGVHAAIAAQVERIAGLAYDNAQWDDAARALYAPKPDRGFIASAWGSAARERVNYDGFYVVDPAGRVIAANRGGRDVAATTLPPAIRALERDTAASHTTADGLALTPGGLALVGVAEILPTSPALARLVPPAGPSRLILLRHLTPALLTEATRSLGLRDLRLGIAGTGRFAIELADARGAGVATLSWRPNRPGIEAVWRALPVLAVALATFLALALLIVRSGIASVRELARQATIDSLSQLPNRRALRRALRDHIAAKQGVALAFLDLDGFKGVNDNYGHAVGDQLIREVSAALAGIAGDDTMVARLGGDEFALLARGGDADARVEALARACLARLALPFHVGERTLIVGASIGTVGCADASLTPGELLRRADIAMYAAKRNGRMRVCRYDPELDAHQAARHRIEVELRQAIAHGEFGVVYQPLVCAGARKVEAVEALVRWTSPTMGEVPPETFVPIAEESGLIDRIGLFVLRRACLDARRWPDLGLAVNVSAAQLRNPDFPADLAEILAETEFPAARLEVEITETYLVREADAARRVLNELRALGVTVSLDDFGTGFASIGFLRQFTFDKLKIDRSLVVDAEHNEAALALVQASVAVARALDIAVTAEGVETQGQADVMRVVGCDQMQGWLFAHAVTASEIDQRFGDRAAA